MNNRTSQRRDANLTVPLADPLPRPADTTQREGEEHFRELMVHLEQVFWVNDATDKAVLYISPAYERIWGRTRQSLYDNHQTLLDSIHPLDRERVVAAVERPGEAEGYDEEYRILRPDGMVRWVRARSYPVRDTQGQTTRFAGIAEDITERKTGEKERSRLAAIIEYSDDVVVSVAVDGIVISWNHGAERQYGYAAEEMMGQSISVLFPPDQSQEYQQLLAKVRRGEIVQPYDGERRCKDGTIVNVSVSLVPIKSRTGEIVGASKISHDITKLKRLEAQFIAAQKMEVMGQLAGGVAHDFNNILAVVMGYAELLLQRLGPDDPMHTDVEEIRNAAERAAGLTRQLLVFSRKQTVQLAVLDLNEVMQSLDKMLRQLVDENIELTVILGTDVSPITGDAGYIGQVLMNLVVNARDAMPGGGKLSIATRDATLGESYTSMHPGVTSGDYAVISVTDTGTGMTDHVKTHLFEPFFTTKPKGRGTGLGLTTCQTIVAQSHGHIDVSSTLGRGTTIKAYFPRAEKPREAVSRTPIKIATLPRGTEALLVVEDEPALRHLACAVLEAHGYEVLSAANGQDGLRVAREHKGSAIGLVVTDVIMPLMGGRTMAEWLRSSSPDLKVLFTSGHTDDALGPHGVLGTGIAFLPKPYTPTTLTRRVRELLDAPN